MNPAIISIKNARKSYGTKVVLKGLSLQVAEGEIYGFLGPNGAGKSTTIKILIGLTDCECDEILLAGYKPLPRNIEYLKNIGVVQEAQSLYDNFTVFENLDLFRKLLGLDPSRLEELLDELKLREYQETKASELSKGFKQRVLIARAFLHKPKILFLDEPSSGLDPIAADKVHQFIKNLKHSGTTVFITSHFMEEVEELCDRVGFLKHGSLIEEGVPSELLKKYSAKRLKDVFLTLLKDDDE